MSELFFKVREEPQKWADARHICSRVVTRAPWEHAALNIAGLTIQGRKSWGAAEPIWENEVIYYNTALSPLGTILTRIVVHHTDNSDSIQANERSQQRRGYAALGYHFFIDQSGVAYEGRPLEIMGSHAGEGKEIGPLNDPDWGSIGIVLQGDYHHADDWFFSSTAPKLQLGKLEELILALKATYHINQLLMHREVREGTVCPGDHLATHVEALRSKLGMQGK